MILLVGPPGSGKSTFCQQAALQSLAIDRPIIFVTTEYGPSEAERALKERGMREVKPPLLNFVNVYHETVGLSVSERPDTVHAHCEDLSSIGIAISKLSERIGRRGVLLVFDSLTSPYLFSGSEVLRFMRMTLSGFAAEGNGVLACVDEGCGKLEDLVAMMGISSGVIKMKTEDSKQLLKIVKHPKLTPSRIEVSIEPKRIGLEERVFNPEVLARFLRGDEAVMRREVGDFVNLFWPNFAHWSGMLWDPKRFPTMVYEMNKEDMPSMIKLMKKNEMIKHAMFPLHMRLLLKFMPKSFSKVKDMKKWFKGWERSLGGPKRERSGIIEYLEDVSKTDEHYIRVYESSECWGFENVGATMAFYLPLGQQAG
jgi:KaiC/GvpD/RAD55 family RecA-like ATPase